MRDAGYRTREEVEDWRARDPIKRLRAHVLLDALADVPTLDGIERQIRTSVDEALEWAKASPYPDPATILDHVYADAPPMPRDSVGTAAPRAVAHA